MITHFRLRNWGEFQHYKDRNPPWIKLHFQLLSSEDWVLLDNASRVLAVACMLVASRNEGMVPNNPAYIQRVAYLHEPPNFSPLIECGFLISDGQMEIPLTIPLEDREEDREEDRDILCSTLQASASNSLARTQSQSPKGFAEFWEVYPRKQAKSAAIKSWIKIKINDPLLIQIIEAVKLQSQTCQWRKDGGKYIPHPATWLNNARWEDDVSCMNAQDDPKLKAGDFPDPGSCVSPNWSMKSRRDKPEESQA